MSFSLGRTPPRRDQCHSHWEGTSRCVTKFLPAEYESNIAAVHKAAEVLKTQKDVSQLQVKPALLQVRESLTGRARELATMLVEQAPAAAAYENQSSGVVGMLEDLAEKFQEEVGRMWGPEERRWGENFSRWRWGAREGRKWTTRRSGCGRLWWWAFFAMSVDGAVGGMDFSFGGVGQVVQARTVVMALGEHEQADVCFGSSKFDFLPTFLKCVGIFGVWDFGLRHG